MPSLMVIIPDRLSNLIEKGEITERYYNPGNLFTEVHLVVTNKDEPNLAMLQSTVGTARLFLHKLPAGLLFFAITLGWRPWLIWKWGNGAIALANRIRPQLIRCHGARINVYAAYRIKKALGIPYVVSMHINPDVDVRGRAQSVFHRLGTWLQQDVEKIGLRNADLVMPVYLPIVPYLKRLGVQNFEVCYNALNPEYLRQKKDYSLNNPVRLISVGRQFKEKNPENILRAIARVPDVILTLVGDGPYHERLRHIALGLGVQERVRFIPSLPNNQLCSLLVHSDIFVVHSEYWEISKSVLEALMTGLPVLINRRQGEPVPELTEEICLMTRNTEDGYFEGIKLLINSDHMRASLGSSAYLHANARWSPSKTESKFIEVYKSVMDRPTLLFPRK